MLSVRYANAFKKDRKLMRKRQKDISCLDEIIRLIINERPLPERCHPHFLHGAWEGCLDCHVFNDWVLIYEIDKQACTVIFHRTGSHADLFK